MASEEGDSKRLREGADIEEASSHSGSTVDVTDEIRVLMSAFGMAVEEASEAMEQFGSIAKVSP